jgi:hypothetical protein
MSGGRTPIEVGCLHEPMLSAQSLKAADTTDMISVVLLNFLLHSPSLFFSFLPWAALEIHSLIVNRQGYAEYGQQLRVHTP